MTAAPAPVPQKMESSASRLALAEEALAAYRDRCFWFLAPDFAVSEATLPLIIEGLRRHGGRSGFQLASQLCH